MIMLPMFHTFAEEDGEEHHRLPKSSKGSFELRLLSYKQHLTSIIMETMNFLDSDETLHGSTSVHWDRSYSFCGQHTVQLWLSQ